jgi:hypothetical protein
VSDEREVRALWRSMSRDERRIVAALAKAGRPHPDPAVRSMAVHWARSVVARPLLLPLVAAGMMIVLWSVLLSVFLRPSAGLFGAILGLLLIAWSMRAQWRMAKDVLRSNLGDTESTTVRPRWVQHSSDPLAFGSKLWHKLALAFLIVVSLCVLAALVASA